MYCPKCGTQLPDQAAFCHSCGTPCGVPPRAVSNAEYEWVTEARKAASHPRITLSASDKARSKATSRTTNPTKWIFIFSGVFILLITLVKFGMWVSSPSEEPSPQAGPDVIQTQLRVRQHCEDYVREYLKAPSTANFSSYTETTVVDQGAGHYAVIGWVDSQNSFGAKLRMNYICKTTDGGTGQWSFERLVVNEGNE